VNALPRCFNRTPFVDPRAGWVDTGRRRSWTAAPIAPTAPLFFKPVLRYRWPWFVDRCVSWDAPKVADSVPAREGWRCHGCRLLPEHSGVLYHAALNEAQAQHAERVGRVLQRSQPR
jgi:hypothetical protein